MITKYDLYVWIGFFLFLFNFPIVIISVGGALQYHSSSDEHIAVISLLLLIFGYFLGRTGFNNW